jgi:hypothetical protein
VSAESPSLVADDRVPGPETLANVLSLRATLLLRACVNGVFTLWVLTGGPGWTDIFAAGSTYALIDGALGLLTGALLARRRPVSAPPLLVSMVLTDALLRIAAGVTVRAFPGVADIPIAVVLFFGALGAWAAVAGIVALAAWLIAHERHHAGSRSRVHALFDPLSAAGLVALALAVYAIIVGPPSTARQLQTTVATATAALTIVFLSALVFGKRAAR